MNEKITNIAIILINLLGKSQKSNFFSNVFVSNERGEWEIYKRIKQNNIEDGERYVGFVQITITIGLSCIHLLWIVFHVLFADEFILESSKNGIQSYETAEKRATTTIAQRI